MGGRVNAATETYVRAKLDELLTADEPKHNNPHSFPCRWKLVHD